MRIDRPRCNVKACRNYLDGNCLNKVEHEKCEHTILIKEMYAIERERKHGHWFLLDECANEGVYCSVCAKKVYRKEYANQKLKSKYCPNCGAIMDGEYREL